MKAEQSFVIYSLRNQETVLTAGVLEHGLDTHLTACAVKREILYLSHAHWLRFFPYAFVGFLSAAALSEAVRSERRARHAADDHPLACRVPDFYPTASQRGRRWIDPLLSRPLQALCKIVTIREWFRPRDPGRLVFRFL